MGGRGPEKKNNRENSWKLSYAEIIFRQTFVEITQVFVYEAPIFAGAPDYIFWVEIFRRTVKIMNKIRAYFWKELQFVHDFC